jgi:hypothetical protein
MVELKNLMDSNDYSSILEIPDDDILDEAAGAIGLDMAEKYVEFLSARKKRTTSFYPDKVLNDPDYVIPSSVKCSIATKELEKRIDVLFDADNLPTDAQMMNVFNALEKRFSKDVDNFVKTLYFHIIKKFGFDNKEYNAFCRTFPNFFNSFVRLLP